jgi:predicted transcriptional regulator
MAAMKGITVKLPEATLRRLRHEARATGRSVAQLIRECVEESSQGGAESVHAIAIDLAGSVAGSWSAATNDRQRFRRQ